MNTTIRLGLTVIFIAGTLSLARATSAADPSVITTKPVPKLLRMHLPVLGENLGLLVDFPSTNSRAKSIGLRSGDILLELNGQPITEESSVPHFDALSPIVVLRRGRTRVLGAANPPQDPFARMQTRGIPWPHAQPAFPRFRDNPALAFPPIGSAGVSVSSSTSSSSAGSEAVSVSRAGDQISLEMSMPELPAGVIRLRGTAAQIARQIESSDLSLAAKSRVRSALRENL